MQHNDQNKDEILDHGQDYDGIKEYDNPLPRWFILMFYGCIIFAFYYSGYYTAKTRTIGQAAGVGYNLAWSGAILAAEVREAERTRIKFVAPEAGKLKSFLRAPANIARGEAMFKANCVACHGEEGQGIIGPNLTDRFWIHGGSPTKVLQSIAKGWPEKGMPAWEPSLGEEKVHWLASYVASIQGRSVSKPKEPQGIADDELVED